MKSELFLIKTPWGSTDAKHHHSQFSVQPQSASYTWSPITNNFRKLFSLFASFLISTASNENGFGVFLRKKEKKISSDFFKKKNEAGSFHPSYKFQPSDVHQQIRALFHQLFFSFVRNVK